MDVHVDDGGNKEWASEVIVGTQPQPEMGHFGYNDN